ncbi:MAG: response regulator transcription factor [Candidatus Omnitrophica bacterium]|nr:response regulator transcription factor [Candidatus Omnitrophota bacterium]
MAITIIIADDHDIIREGIKSVLKPHTQYQVLAEAKDGEDALEKVRELKPDILLLDITMPKVSGLDIIERLKRSSAKTKIIVISVHKIGSYVIKALRAGVSGYLNKDNVAEELITALSRVSAGRTYLGESISDYLSEVIREPEKSEITKGKLLNERELDILRLVAEGKTAKEIADTLFLSRRTVENYKNSILKKLNLHKTSDLIKYAIENKIIDSV